MTEPRGSDATMPRESEWTVLAGVLDLLAAAFGEPRADLRGRAGALAESTARLAGGVRMGELLGALASAEPAGGEVEFARLFVAGRHAVAHPYESFYRSGRLYDPECIESLDRLFSLAGVQPERGALAADHLSVELDFLALLLRGLAGAAAGSEGREALQAIAGAFLDEHLTQFVTAFSERLEALDPAPHFAAAGRLLVEAGHAARHCLYSLPVGTPHD